ncbi:MAG TPA: L-histidine N(alpha)-methyltransferase [Polyangiaceae bacterium]|jgi:dimethylhistidine N-methyltransferase|nr:L-histidine N(alpha)-methyltransferase [Polyangiaceae bacterium]
MITDAILRYSLGSKPLRIPSAFLYDELGSALFDAITLLPEYPLSRIGLRLLQDSLPELVELASNRVIELGPGSGKLSSVLLSGFAARRQNVEFTAVDISDYALRNCQRALQHIEWVQMQAIHADYITGLRQAVALGKSGERNLVLFLGSNLANFDPYEAAAFLKEMRQVMNEGDALVLAVDLEKDPGALIRAYDDSLGVTAAFNKNVLVRLNRHWQANFPLDAFVHKSLWNADHRRIEMHLFATMDCTVTIPRLQRTLQIRSGESLWTESSYRFSVSEIADWATAARFRIARQWVDPDWPFVQLLLIGR